MSITYTFDEGQYTELCEIMGRNKSDKGSKDIVNSHHNYTTFYYSIFKKICNNNLRLFELGLGTNNPNIPSNMGLSGRPGASLYGWSEFFPNAEIFGADIDTNILFNNDRINTFFCDQLDTEIIKTMWNEPKLHDNCDIIIEVGLHTFKANVCFFEDILNYEEFLFINKIKEWEKIYIDCHFSLLKIPSSRNNCDNTLLVVYKK
jgi:hypothetical protein